MSEQNRELRQYLDCMDTLHAPEELYTEVWNMTLEQHTASQETKPAPAPVRRFPRPRLLPLVAAIVLILALSAVTYAAKPSLFGWGGNFEVRDTGHGTESVLHTDSLVDPVEVEDGRLWFIVNGEHIDITDQTSETEPFYYDYTDEDGVIHYWLVGKNGPELGNWGYGEFLYKPGEDWIGGYSARVNLGPDDERPPWLAAGKAKLNLPW
ncbi:MAG: hypothetical protein IJV40_13640 [Oscillospiraceae bacterium]|nr:hypothetical protein [Oscillospiraceae bacterium]